VREDAQTLYGFIGKQERDLFELLLTISGIGPKTALGIVGHMEMGPFQRAVTTGDTRLLSKLPGIGKKTAERLVLEMRDKFTGKKGKIAPVDLGHSLLSDAVNALMNLGYNPLDSQEAVQEALKEQSEEKDLGRLISLALQKI
jgi:Holliday junction DNA helicase RuvA